MAIITIKELLELRSKELIGKRIKLVRHKDDRTKKLLMGKLLMEILILGIGITKIHS